VELGLRIENGDDVAAFGNLEVAFAALRAREAGLPGDGKGVY